MSAFRIDDEPIVPAIETPKISTAEDLQNFTLAVSVSFTWMGRTRKLTDDQQSTAAESLEADKASIRSSKRLFAFKNYEPLKKITRIKGKISKIWKGLTLPFTTEGIRLLRIELQPAFELSISEERDALLAAAADLQLLRQEMIDKDREQLGQAFAESDYPADFSAEFGVTWEYPNLNPNPDLKLVDAAVFARESARVRKQFETAHEKAEQLLAEELSHMLGNLSGRLLDVSTGKSKRMPMQQIENFRDFFERSRTFNFTSNEELARVLRDAEEMLDGINEASDLRVEHSRENLRETTNQILKTVGEIGILDKAGRRCLRVAL